MSLYRPLLLSSHLEDIASVIASRLDADEVTSLNTSKFKFMELGFELGSAKAIRVCLKTW